MTKQIVTQLKRLMREDEGTEVVEWALVAGLIIAVGAAVFTLIGDQVTAKLNSLLTELGGTPETQTQ